MQLFDSLSVCFGNVTSAGAAAANIHKGGCGWKELGPIVNELLKNVLLLGVFIGTGMIMYAGYVLIKGQGSADSRSRVRRIFLNLVIGFFLLVGSYYIVKFVLDTIGLNSAYREQSIVQ